METFAADGFDWSDAAKSDAMAVACGFLVMFCAGVAPCAGSA